MTFALQPGSVRVVCQSPLAMQTVSVRMLLYMSLNSYVVILPTGYGRMLPFLSTPPLPLPDYPAVHLKDRALVCLIFLCTGAISHRVDKILQMNTQRSLLLLSL